MSEFFQFWVSILPVPLITMFVTWLVYLVLRNPGIVDLAWELGFMTSITVLLLQSPSPIAFNSTQFIAWVCVILWGTRLSYSLIVHRLMKGEKEKRYDDLQPYLNKNQGLKYFLHFQLQALFQWIILLAFVPVFMVTIPITYITILALLIFTIGFIGEWVADHQLRLFKESRAGKVCNIGLWNYSRHPNLFFEFVIWVGIALLSWSNLNFFWSMVGPIILLHTMYNITGPVTEKNSVKSRGKAYQDYQKKTPYFFPGAPK